MALKAPLGTLRNGYRELNGSAFATFGSCLYGATFTEARRQAEFASDRHCLSVHPFSAGHLVASAALRMTFLDEAEHFIDNQKASVAPLRDPRSGYPGIPFTFIPESHSASPEYAICAALLESDRSFLN